jgi:hypothetical protein
MLDTSRHLWTLSDGGEDSLGLSCTNDGLFLGRTPLLERQDGRFTVRAQIDLERLLSSGFGLDAALDRLMLGLNTVAAALNAGDLCRARIAAVQLRIPELPDPLARIEMETEDLLIRLEQRADALARADWDPAKHPRAGTAPNPGWFAPAGDASSEAEMPLSAPQGGDEERVRLPPGERIDELGDFLEWIANAKPEDEQAIRGEIKRLYYDVGDVLGGNALNKALTDALDAGTDEKARQEILDSIEIYARADPAEVAQFGRDLTTGALLSPPGAAIAAPIQVGKNIWKMGWATRGLEAQRILGNGLGEELPPNFPVIDYFFKGIATSIKSIDLNAATYQSAQRLSARLNSYVDQLAKFSGRTWAKVEVAPSAIRGRELNIAIPKGSVTATQRTAMDAAIERAKAGGVILRFTPL